MTSEIIHATVQMKGEDFSLEELASDLKEVREQVQTYGITILLSTTTFKKFEELLAVQEKAYQVVKRITKDSEIIESGDKFVTKDGVEFNLFEILEDYVQENNQDTVQE